MENQDNKLNSKSIKHRVITMLDRQELDFLDKLGKDALFSVGHKLSYSEILKGLIDFSIEIGFSGDRVNSSIALKEKMMKEVSQIKGGER